MKFILIFTFLSWICNIQSFLLHDRTLSPLSPTTDVPPMSDHHYTALVNMLMSERDDRRELEKIVSNLQKELLATQTGVTDLYYDRRNESEALKQMDEKYNQLRTKYDSLKADFDILNNDFNHLSKTCDENGNKTTHLEAEVSSLKQLKAIGDWQTVVNIQTETTHLDQELQLTNRKLNTMSNEADARKQDFVALLMKADTTERQLNSSIKELRKNDNITVSILENYVDTKFSALQANQSIRLSKLRNSQNLSEQKIRDLQREVRTQPNRVAITASTITQKTYSPGSTIVFPNIYTTHGINSSSLTELKTTGVFTCTRPGLYLISVFIMTPTHQARADVYKNNDQITNIYFSLNGSYQTSSITVLEQLSVNDKIYVKVLGSVVVWGDNISSMSILQITE